MKKNMNEASNRWLALRGAANTGGTGKGKYNKKLIVIGSVVLLVAIFSSVLLFGLVPGGSMRAMAGSSSISSISGKNVIPDVYSPVNVGVGTHTMTAEQYRGDEVGTSADGIAAFDFHIFADVFASSAHTCGNIAVNVLGGEVLGKTGAPEFGSRPNHDVDSTKLSYVGDLYGWASSTAINKDNYQVFGPNVDVTGKGQIFIETADGKKILMGNDNHGSMIDNIYKETEAGTYINIANELEEAEDYMRWTVWAMNQAKEDANVYTYGTAPNSHSVRRVSYDDIIMGGGMGMGWFGFGGTTIDFSGYSEDTIIVDLGSYTSKDFWGRETLVNEATQLISGMVSLKGTVGKRIIFNIDTTALNGADLTFFDTTMTADKLTNSEDSALKDNNILWNFYQMENGAPVSYDGKITVGGTWMGTVLAPDATVYCRAGLNGSIIADKVTTTAETHKSDYTGERVISTTVSVTVTKIWEDVPSMRPEFISIQLLRDGKVIETVQLSESNVTTDGDYKWYYTFTDLPAADAGGNTYQYKVKELKVPGYKTQQVNNTIINTSENKNVAPVDYKLTVNKTDGTNGLAGATMRLTSKDGVNLSVVKAPDVRGAQAGSVKITDKEITWISDGEPVEINKLPAGTYIVSEISAPDGYKLAADQTVTINGSKTVTVVNTPIEVKFNKFNGASGNNAILPGAGFELTANWNTDLSKVQVTGAASNSYDANTKKITFTTGNSAVGFKGIPAGSYTLTETVVPSGYQPSAPITFIIDASGKVTVNGAEASSVEMTNYLIPKKPAVYNLTVTKTGGATQDVIGGATLKLTAVNSSADLSAVTVTNADNVQKNGNTITWTTIEDKNAVLAGLPEGSYTLSELSAPAGYEKAADISVTLNGGDPDSQNDRDAAMHDDLIEFTVSKLDSISGTYVSGAVLQLVDNSGKVVAEWTTDGGAHKLSGIAAGTYTLKEKTPPAGYKTASDIASIVVDAYGNVAVGGSSVLNNNVTMYDEPTQVSIAKQYWKAEDDKDTSVDSDETGLLGGASLTLAPAEGQNISLANVTGSIPVTHNEDGSISWTSGAQANSLRGLPAGNYTLTETEAPAGYVKAAPITFTVDASGNVSNLSTTNAGDKIDDGTVYLTDKKEIYYPLSIDKIDKDTEASIAGATLAIFKADVTEFTAENAELVFVSTGAPSQFVLPDGHYVLAELEAPKGYDRTEELVYFELKTGGNVAVDKIEGGSTEDPGSGDSGNEGNEGNEGGNENEGENNITAGKFTFDVPDGVSVPNSGSAKAIMDITSIVRKKGALPTGITFKVNVKNGDKKATNEAFYFDKIGTFLYQKVDGNYTMINDQNDMMNLVNDYTYDRNLSLNSSYPYNSNAEYFLVFAIHTQPSGSYTEAQYAAGGINSNPITLKFSTGNEIIDPKASSGSVLAVTSGDSPANATLDINSFSLDFPYSFSHNFGNNNYEVYADITSFVNQNANLPSAVKVNYSSQTYTIGNFYPMVIKVDSSNVASIVCNTHGGDYVGAMAINGKTYELPLRDQYDANAKAYYLVLMFRAHGTDAVFDQNEFSAAVINASIETTPSTPPGGSNNTPLNDIIVGLPNNATNDPGGQNNWKKFHYDITDIVMANGGTSNLGNATIKLTSDTAKKINNLYADIYVYDTQNSTLSKGSYQYIQKTINANSSETYTYELSKSSDLPYDANGRYEYFVNFAFDMEDGNNSGFTQDDRTFDQTVLNSLGFDVVSVEFAKNGTNTPSTVNGDFIYGLPNGVSSNAFFDSVDGNAFLAYTDITELVKNGGKVPNQMTLPISFNGGTRFTGFVAGIAKVDANGNATSLTNSAPSMTGGIPDGSSYNAVFDFNLNETQYVEGNKYYIAIVTWASINPDNLSSEGMFSNCGNLVASYKTPSGGLTAGDIIIEEPANGEPVVIKLPNSKSANPNQYSIQLTKQDKDDSSKLLNGAKFKLYDSEGNLIKADDNGNGTYTYNASGSVTEFVTANGTITVNKLPVGDYYFYETEAPSGYILNGERADVTVTKANTSGSPASVIVKNEAQKRTLTINKVDVNGNPLAGAGFNLYYAPIENGAVNYGNDNAQYVGYYETTEGGKIVVPNSALQNDGVYFVQETKAPAGMLAASGNWPQLTANVTDPEGNIYFNESYLYGTALGTNIPAKLLQYTKSSTDANGNTVEGGVLKGEYKDTTITAYDATIVVTDVPVQSGFVKTDSNGVKLPGAVFKLEPANGGATTTTEPIPALSAVYATAIVNGAETRIPLTDNYQIKYNDDGSVAGMEFEYLTWTSRDSEVKLHGLPEGTYTLSEVSAPAGYKLADPITVTVGADGKVNGAASVTMIDQPLTGSISMTKYDAVSGEVISGAQFVLKSKDGSYTSETLTTDANGTITVDGLAWGKTYFFEEITPAAGYTAEGAVFTPAEVEITADNYAETAYVTVSNKRLDNGTITLVKVDGVDRTTPIQGAEFELQYRVAGSGDAFVVYTTGITDANGKITVGSLPWGYEYKFVETKAAEGYDINTLVFTSAEVVEIQSGDSKTVTAINSKPISVSVEKVWNDNNNQDGIRPADVEVTLHNGSTVVATATLNAGNSWKNTWFNLPATDKDGNVISYTVTEEEIEGYELESITGSMANGFVIKNKYAEGYTPLKTTLQISKVWNDDSNRDNKRPTSIEVEIYANDVLYRTETLSKGEQTGDVWNFTITDLPKNAGGNEIEYTIKEKAVGNGYTSSVSGFEITNTRVSEVTSVEITKIWNDNDDQDRVRPTEITVNLYANNSDTPCGTYTLKKGEQTGNTWKWTIENLPKNAGGEPIVYSVKEVVVNGYTTTISGLTITNTHTPGVTSYTVKKVWNDNSDQDGIRPDSVQVTLTGSVNGTVIDAYTQTVPVSGTGNTWTYTFSNLAQKHEGQTIVYSVDEANVPDGYEKSVSGNTITNTHTPATVKVSVNKVWSDGNNQDGTRPGTITFRLSNGTSEVGFITLNVTGSESHVWTDLPKYANGNEITYTVTEDKVEGYTTTVSEADKTTVEGEIRYTVTNSYTPAITSVTINKVWNHGTFTGAVPTSVTVQLYKGGIAEGEPVTLTEANSWTHTWNNLPKKANGNDIEYTVTETAVPGYTASTSREGNTVTITNTRQADGKLVLVKADAANGSAIKGAEFDLMYRIPGAAEFTLYNKYTTDDNGKIEVTGLNLGYEYKFVETKAAYGYQLNTEFAESEAVELTETVRTYQFNVENARITTNAIFSKIDVATTNELPGATLIITHKGGLSLQNVTGYTVTSEVDVENKSNRTDSFQWVSGDEPVALIGLPVGTYTLTELSAPYGYTVAEQIEFVIKEDRMVYVDDDQVGALNKVEMEDAPVTATISKQQVGGGSELPGAVLTVKLEAPEAADATLQNVTGTVEFSDKTANSVTWTSTTERNTLSALPDGIYSLTETTAPAGYEIAETMYFKVDGGKIYNVTKTDDGYTVGTEVEEDTVVMYDAPSTGEATISKQQVGGGSELPGAVLTVKLEAPEAAGATLQKVTGTVEFSNKT
ncbi:MAG: Cna B-type domain-containing protein, partial [Ruminococcaceae bacterium]|nr:Cna B-type domain-containing protein [Oscillospiraceae bacterium]